MLLTAHQPNYLPYPGFFQKVASADEFLIVDTTQFVKRGPFGWIHRNKIGTPNGPIWLTLPVLTKGRFDQRICEVELDPRRDWAKKHWKSLEWNYSQSPHWEQFSPGLKKIYQRSWSHLSPLTTEIIRWFFNVLEIDLPFHLASDLKADGVATDYILAFCRELGATEFLSGIHGRDYLEVDRFTSENIKLHFQEYSPPIYSVPGRSVLENLSMLDAILWGGEEVIEWVHSTERSYT